MKDKRMWECASTGMRLLPVKAYTKSEARALFKEQILRRDAIGIFNKQPHQLCRLPVGVCVFDPVQVAENRNRLWEKKQRQLARNLAKSDKEQIK